MQAERRRAPLPAWCLPNATGRRGSQGLAETLFARRKSTGKGVDLKWFLSASREAGEAPLLSRRTVALKYADSSAGTRMLPRRQGAPVLILLNGEGSPENKERAPPYNKKKGFSKIRKRTSQREVLSDCRQNPSVFSTLGFCFADKK